MDFMQLITSRFGPVTISTYEQQNSDYNGVIVAVEQTGMKIRCRLAKKTPKKIGYFVAFWEKNENNQNEAYSEKDKIDALAIVVQDDEKIGVFVIPKKALIHHKILSTNQFKGKMGMRFYPSWEKNLNKTATQTQKWQLRYFTDLQRAEGK